MPRKIMTMAAISALCTAGAAVPATATPERAGLGDLIPRVSYGEYQSYQEGANAITYDERVPEGAQTQLTSVPLPDGSTKITVGLSGLLPNREYGAHVHTNRCGPTGSDAGPHFQNVRDPERPSVNPEYANPRNEVWLDFTTNAEGEAVATAHGDWQFAGKEANSFVIHEEHTHTAPGEAGEAGARLACMNARF